MKKIPKILLAGLLLGTLILTGCPTNPPDEPEKPKVTLSSRISSAKEGDTIDILKENLTVEPNVSYTISKKLTLMNGDVKDGKFTIYVSGVIFDSLTGIDTVKITSAVKDGDFTLKNCGTVKEVIVNGGGSNSIHITDTKVLKLTSNKANVRIVLGGKTNVEKSYVLENAKIEAADSSTTSLGDVVVSAKVEKVELKGEVAVDKIVSTASETSKNKPVIKVENTVTIKKADTTIKESITNNNNDYTPTIEIEDATISEEDKTDIENAETEASKPDEPVIPDNPNIPETNLGIIKGKAIYSNGETHGGIYISLEKVVNGRTVLANGARTIAAQVETDDDGNYEFKDVETGFYTVYASSTISVEQVAVSEPVEVKGGQTTTVPDLTLTGVGSISGNVTFRGERTEGLLVYIAGTSYQAKTDADGNYLITGVPAREEGYTIIAETADGAWSAAATSQVVVIVEKTVEADAIAINGSVVEYVRACTPVENGIFFKIAIPNYSGGKKMHIEVKEVSSGVVYSWDNTYSNSPTNYSFVYPFVDAGKTYTFNVEYLDDESNFYIFRERVHVTATGGLGEVSVTNLDKINLRIDTNTEDSIIVKIDEAPVLNDFGLDYTMSTAYNTYTSYDGVYGKWLYDGKRPIVDERSFSFDIFDPITYHEGWGAWRDVGYMKGYIWGHEFTASLKARIELFNTPGTFIIPVKQVSAINPGNQVNVNVRYDKGLAIIYQDKAQIQDFDDGDIDDIIDLLDEIENEEYWDSLEGITEEEYLQLIKTYLKNIPESETVPFGGRASEPVAIPTYTPSYTDSKTNKIVELNYLDFAGWVDKTGKKVSFADYVEPVEGENFTNPSAEYRIYPAFTFKAVKVKFDTNGGSFIPSVFVTLGGRLNCGIPKKDDVVFAGWYYDNELTEPFDSYFVPDEYFNSDFNYEVTLYAKWVEPILAIDFDDSNTGDLTLSKWGLTSNNYCSAPNSLKSMIEGEHSASATALLTVDDCAAISFSYKVSSESSCDNLIFYIDDERINSWSGEMDWNTYTYTISLGTHEFKWEYSKDGSVNNGYDCAWIDDIVVFGE